MWNRPYIGRQPSNEIPWLSFGEFAPELNLGGRVRILSQDREDGAATCLWSIPSGWRYDGGYRLSGAEQLFVLEGDLLIGADRFTTGSYGYRPPGYLNEARASKSGALVLAFWDSALKDARSGIGLEKPVGDGATFVDTINMPAMPTPVSGPPTGIVVKILNREAATGGMTMLVTIPPGWSEERAEHHDCIEESFKISGDIWIVENHRPHTLSAGDYFFRPPRIKHGPMKTTHGTTSLIRFSALVENHYGEIQ